MIRRVRTSPLLLAAALALTACASASPATPGAPRRDPNVLTAADLSADGIATLSALDAIQRLRPIWLRARGATSVTAMGDQTPVLMVNDGVQPLAALGSMRATDLTSARFISGTDATTMYGTGYVNGLIKVTTGSMR